MLHASTMFSKLHARAQHAVKILNHAECDMIPLIQEIDECEGYRELGYPSLFSYLVRGLELSEACSYHYIRVSRRAHEVPRFQAALLQGEIPLSKGKAIAGVITRENAEEWIRMAMECTVRELEKKVTDKNPEASRIERVRNVSEGMVELTVTLDTSTLELLKRTREVLAQKNTAPFTYANALFALAEYYLQKEDPVRQAERATSKESNKADPLVRAKQKAQARDKGKCQYNMPDGSICGSGQWVDLHHIKPKSEGGKDTVENLITLCSAHHRMAHAPPHMHH